MSIPNGVIVPLFLLSFVALYYQYFRINPDRRLLNMRFGLMAGAVVLTVASVFMTDWPLSPVFFVLGLLWLGLSLYLLRFLPPREN
jgi:glucan phosphoethanolaminetransferase (alkaline phosphatase superfamily)